jgi:hypothetical protein
MRFTLIALALSAIVATPVIAPVLNNDRDRKLEVYSAFAAHYGEGNAVNLADVTTRFDASNEDVLMCAPSVLLTTAATRHFRTQTFAQDDFAASPIRVVDPEIQGLLVQINDPDRNITSENDLAGALEDAFDAGLLQVSDVGFNITGQRAVLTFSFSCGMLCGHSGTAMMERRNGQWVRSPRRCGYDAIN